jgi:hypothetical protein
MKKCCFPRTENTPDKLAIAKSFPTLHLTSGYRQLDLYPTRHKKTALPTWQAVQKISVIPIRFSNIRPTFEFLMESILRALTSHFYCTWWYDRRRSDIPTADFESMESVPVVQRAPRQIEPKGVSTDPEWGAVFGTHVIPEREDHKSEEV